MAEFGHLEIVWFLHETRRSEDCTTDTIDGAIVNGHFEVVKFLHENRTEGYTAAAMNRAARNYRYSVPRHLHVIRFLLEHRSEHDLLAAMTEAVACNHLEVVQLLHSHLRAGESVYPVLASGRHLDRTAVWFLCNHQEDECTRLLLEAVANGPSRLSRLYSMNPTTRRFQEMSSRRPERWRSSWASRGSSTRLTESLRRGTDGQQDMRKSESFHVFKLQVTNITITN